MIQRIHCLSCDNLYAEGDTAFNIRRVKILCKKPPVHGTKETIIKGGVTTIIERELSVMKCDMCGNDMPDGTLAVALTYWSHGNETPAAWEGEYGTIQS